MVEIAVSQFISVGCVERLSARPLAMHRPFHNSFPTARIYARSALMLLIAWGEVLAGVAFDLAPSVVLIFYSVASCFISFCVFAR